MPTFLPFLFCHILLLLQLPFLEVEFSDKPKLEPLTLDHVQGPLALLASALIAATLVWLAEMGSGRLINKRQEIARRTTEVDQKIINRMGGEVQRAW